MKASFMLMLPPSANRLHRNGRARPYTSPEYLGWRNSNLATLRACDLDPVHGAFTAAIELPAKMRGDIDNRAKAVLDLCQAAGIIDDDKLAQALTVARSEFIRPGMCRVTIKEHHPADAGMGAAGRRDATAPAAIPLTKRGAASINHP